MSLILCNSRYCFCVSRVFLSSTGFQFKSSVADVTLIHGVMKLTIKTLKGNHFEIRVQPSDTVSNFTAPPAMLCFVSGFYFLSWTVVFQFWFSFCNLYLPARKTAAWVFVYLLYDLLIYFQIWEAKSLSIEYLKIIALSLLFCLVNYGLNVFVM